MPGPPPPPPYSRVPWKRTAPQLDDVQVGEPVRGRTWHEIALLVHWIRGHGQHLIPAHATSTTIAPGNTHTFRYKVKPSGRAIARVWFFVLRSDNPPGAGIVRLTLPTGGTVTVSPPVETGLGDGGRRMVVEELSAKSATETEVSFSAEHVGAGADVFVDAVSCFELPRAVLLWLDAVDEGLNLDVFRPGGAIHNNPSGAHLAIAPRIPDLVANTWPRRSLVHQAFAPLEVNTGVWTNLHALPIRIVPKKVGRTDTTFEVAWDVLARATDGSTSGEVRITSHIDGTTKTVTVPIGGTSMDWRGPSTLEVRCEDLGEPDGLPGGSWEGVTFAARRTAGTGGIQVAGWDVWEPT